MYIYIDISKPRQKCLPLPAHHFAVRLRAPHRCRGTRPAVHAGSLHLPGGGMHLGCCGQCARLSFGSLASRQHCTCARAHLADDQIPEGSQRARSVVPANSGLAPPTFCIVGRRRRPRLGVRASALQRLRPPAAVPSPIAGAQGTEGFGAEEQRGCGGRVPHGTTQAPGRLASHTRGPAALRCR